MSTPATSTIDAAGRAFVNLRATGILPDGRMCPMTGLPEHGPALPAMRDVNAHGVFPVDEDTDGSPESWRLFWDEGMLIAYLPDLDD